MGIDKPKSCNEAADLDLLLSVILREPNVLSTFEKSAQRRYVETQCCRGIFIPLMTFGFDSHERGGVFMGCTFVAKIAWKMSESMSTLVSLPKHP